VLKVSFIELIYISSRFICLRSTLYIQINVKCEIKQTRERRILPNPYLDLCRLSLTTLIW